MIRINSVDAFEGGANHQVAYRESQSRIDTMTRKMSHETTDFDGKTWDQQMSEDEKRGGQRLTRQEYQNLVGHFIF